MGSVHLGFDDPSGDVLPALIATLKRSLPAHTKVESSASIILFIGSHGDSIIQAKRPDGKIHSNSEPKIVIVGSSVQMGAFQWICHDFRIETVGILVHHANVIKDCEPESINDRNAVFGRAEPVGGAANGFAERILWSNISKSKSS